MRRPLGASLAAVLLGLVLTATGCGQDQTEPIPDDQPSLTEDPTEGDTGDEDDKEPQGRVDFELAEMVTETAAGGKVDPEAIALGDEVAVQEFSKQFESEAMQARLLGLIDTIKVPEGKALYAAVVAIGCEVPPGVVVTSTDTGLRIEAQPTPSSPRECVAAMTSVALVLVDEEIVG